MPTSTRKSTAKKTTAKTAPAAPKASTKSDGLAFVLDAITHGVTFHDEVTANAVRDAIADLGDPLGYDPETSSAAKAIAKAKAEAA